MESVGSLFPYEEVIISSEIEGPVEEVKADLGDRVTPSQVLVRISDEEQRYLLAQNEAQLRQALERLGLKNEKDRVKDIKETPDVRRAQADLFDAEQRYKRVRNLVEQQIGSRQDLDQALARYQSAPGRLRHHAEPDPQPDSGGGAHQGASWTCSARNCATPASARRSRRS